MAENKQGVQEYRVTVTPHDAQKWLDENNGHNRKVKPKDVARYAHDMRIGDWMYAADPIRFDQEMQLLDGQHRLLAVVESGMEQEFLIVTGLQTESRLYMDQGNRRTAGDQLKLELGMKDGNRVAAIARMIMLYQDKQLISPKRNYGNNEIVEFVRERQEAIGEAVGWYTGLRRLTPRYCGPAIGTIGYAALMESRQWALDFRSAMIEGADLKAGDPVLTLRSKLIARRRPSDVPEAYQELWLYARVWRGWQNKETLRSLPLPPGGVTTEKLVQLLRRID